MTTDWEMLAVWLAEGWPPNLAHACPVCGTEVPFTFEHTEVVQRGEPGEPRRLSASVQFGLLAGSPVAASKPPSWISSAAAAGPVSHGTRTSSEATSSSPQAA